MELTRKFVAAYPTRFAAYLALEVALMRRFVARGGTEEEFCRRLAPVFHRRYAPVLLGAAPGTRHLTSVDGTFRLAQHEPRERAPAAPHEAHERHRIAPAA
jgi:hypothetical protein